MDTQTPITLRRHTATLAQDVLALRQALDGPLGSAPAYRKALTLLGEAVDSLCLMRHQLDAGPDESREFSTGRSPSRAI